MLALHLRIGAIQASLAGVYIGFKGLRVPGLRCRGLGEEDARVSGFRAQGLRILGFGL